MAIHLFKEGDGYEIWTDCADDEPHTGRCIGSGQSISEARADALLALRSDVAGAEALTDEDDVHED